MQTNVHLRTELVVVSSQEGEVNEELFKSEFEAVCLHEESGTMLRHAEPENNGRTEIVISPTLVELKRTGDTSSRMVFIPAQLVDATYVTPHGALPVAIYTHSLAYEGTPTAGSLRIKYAVLINGGHVTDNELFMTWTA